MAGVVANLSNEQPLLQDDYSTHEPGESRRRRSKGSKKSKKGKRKKKGKKATRVVSSVPQRSPIAEAMGVR